MAISLHEQSVPVEVIAKAAGVAVEVVKGRCKSLQHIPQGNNAGMI
jgi:hypothetical protein